jgi:hypothetical protein
LILNTPNIIYKIQDSIKIACIIGLDYTITLIFKSCILIKNVIYIDKSVCKKMFNFNFTNELLEILILYKQPVYFTEFNVLIKH